MSLENLRDIFEERGTTTGTPQEPQNSNLLNFNSANDNFTSFPKIDFNTSDIVLQPFQTTTNAQPAFPLNYTPLNQVVRDEFINLGNGLQQNGWPNLYTSRHKSITVDQPSPRSENPFQPFQYGNPNIKLLDIRDSDVNSNFFSPSRGDEPYIISEISTGGSSGSGGRKLNQGNRLFPLGRAKTDFKRIGRYLKSPAGLLFLAAQNAHLLVDTVVVRNNDELLKTRQRFNAGFNGLSMLGSVGLRVLGQATPNLLIPSGFSMEYGESAGGFLSIFEKLGDNGDIPTSKGGRIGNKTKERNEKTGARGPGGFTDEGRKSHSLYFLRDSFDGATSDVNGKFIPQPRLGFTKKIAKSSTGDKATLSRIVKGEGLLSYEGNTAIINATNSADEVGFEVEHPKNGMPLYFKDLRDNAYIFFRAYIEGLTEDIAPSWSEHTYLGRSEPVYVYERATRSVTFSLKLVAQTVLELTAIYRKLNRLTSLCYPEYAKDVRMSDKTRMKPPLTKFRFGDLFGGGAENVELLGFIESLSYTYPDEGTYETHLGMRVPKHVTATITYKVIHGTVPELHKNGKTSLDAGQDEVDTYNYYGYNSDFRF